MPAFISQVFRHWGLPSQSDPSGKGSSRLYGKGSPRLYHVLRTSEHMGVQVPKLALVRDSCLPGHCTEEVESVLHYTEEWRDSSRLSSLTLPPPQKTVFIWGQ